jgi:tetratricopeptide (TPR) repeat protein
MAIEGPVQELALCDLLQLLGLSQKSGTLRVVDEARGRSAVVYFERGRVVGAVAPDHATRIDQLLLLAGKVTAAQIDQAVREQRRQPGRRLGSILIESGAVTREDVEHQVRFQVAEIVYGLVRWGEGNFRFEEEPPLAWGPVSIALPVESLLMEAMRRADELALLDGGAADAAEVVPALAAERARTAPLELQPLEWEVLAEVDGERSLRAIARSVGRAEFEVAKAIFALASAGVVEVGARQRPPPPDPAPGSPTGPPDLGSVERALAQGRYAEARHAFDALLRLHPTDSGVQLLLARVQEASGETAAAAGTLEALVRRDPLCAPAYLALGMLSARTGALERAGDSLSTYLRLSEPGEPRRATALRAASAVAELRRALQEWEER